VAHIDDDALYRTRTDGPEHARAEASQRFSRPAFFDDGVVLHVDRA
jgi:hypothetical protein